MRKIFYTLILLTSSLIAENCERILERNIGWTIIDSKTIDGYKDNGKEKKNDFEGCDFDRIIFFTDGTKIRCNSYGYSYSYMPKAIILGKSFNNQGKNITMYKMIVNGDEYAIY